MRRNRWAALRSRPAVVETQGLNKERKAELLYARTKPKASNGGDAMKLYGAIDLHSNSYVTLLVSKQNQNGLSEIRKGSRPLFFLPLPYKILFSPATC
jgi:hypothetical protein